MRIIEEKQLDFSDLLIQPKRSTLNSRSEVDLFRTFEWTGIHGKANSLNCIPIIAANMASVGTPKMAKILAKRGYLCALEKHIPVWDLERLYDELEELARKSKKPMNTYTQRIMPTVGLNDCATQLDKLAENHEVKCICIDIPNGYVPSFTGRVQQIAGQHPDALIFAGNVVTGDISQDLVLARRCNSIHHTGKVGMCAKVGIGSGCFIGNMKVLTAAGLKKIQDIDIGEFVLTHNGKFEKVINKFTYNTHKHIIDINGIKCTPNHKFYVAKIEDLSKITDKNYKDYCCWIEAKDLDETKYKLVKIT